jgi:hypothetical protein
MMWSYYESHTLLILLLVLVDIRLGMELLPH